MLATYLVIGFCAEHELERFKEAFGKNRKARNGAGFV
jgi:hypothetical protein